MQHEHVWYRGSVPSDRHASARLGGHRGLRVASPSTSTNPNVVGRNVVLTGMIHADSKSWTLAFANEDGSGGLILTENDPKDDAAMMSSMDGASCVQHSTFEPHDDGHNHDHDHGIVGDLNRDRRGGPASSSHTECNVFLDADSYYYNRWKGECLPGWSAVACETQQVARVTVRMIETLHQIDELYRRDTKLGGKVTLAVAGTHVFTSSSSGVANMNGKSSDAVLKSYKEWLATGHSLSYDQQSRSWVSDTDAIRGPGQPKAFEVCLNHLFTHVDFNTGTLGVAVMEGICREHGWFVTSNGNYATSNSDLGSELLNAGFTTTLSRGKSAPLWQTVAVGAHELGHNFGARHDCCTSCSTADLLNGNDQICPTHQTTINGDIISFDAQGSRASCVPYGTSTTSQNGGYLMYPSMSNDQESPYGTTFSTCSVSDIEATLSSRGQCLKVPDPCASGGGCCDSDNNLKVSGVICRGYVASPFPMFHFFYTVALCAARCGVAHLCK